MNSMSGGDPGAPEDIPSSSINELSAKRPETAVFGKSHNDTAEGIPASDARANLPETDEVATEHLHKHLEKMEDGDPDELKELSTLLRQNLINSHSKDYKSETALHIAARRGLIGATKLLLEAHASVREEDYDGSQPLHTACWEENDAIVDLLLEHGANANALNHNKNTPLQIAVVSGSLPIVQRLVKVSELNIDIKGGLSGMNALNRAVWYENVEIARALLDAGAKVNVQDYDGWTPLWCATYKKNAEMINLLLKHKDHSQLEIPDNNGVTPLLLAIKNKFAEGVTALLEKGANCNASADHKSCLHWAVLNFSREVFSELMKQEKIQIDDGDGDGITALHYACGARDKDGTRLELSSGEENPNANARYEDAYLDIVKGLRAKGADLLAKTSKNETALHFAARYRRVDLVNSLLSHMPNHIWIAEDSSRRTPLDALLERDQDDTEGKAIMEAFIKACQDEEFFNRALLLAATNFERHKVALLLLSINQENNEAKLSDGNSAIEWATYREMPEALWWLIATSPPGSETTQSITSAKKLLKTKKTSSLEPFGNHEGRDNSKLDLKTQRGKEMGFKWVNPDYKELSNDSTNILGVMDDVLKDPPVAQIYNDNRTLDLPTLEPRYSAISQKYEARIVEFHRTDTVFSTICRARNIVDTIYKAGPLAIMKDAADQTSKIIRYGRKGSKHGDQLIAIEKMYKMDHPRLTWVHLPATNIKWMKDLLTRIMIDEGYRSNDFHEVDSFLRDTWFETPDRESSSRIMRPQFVTRKLNTSAIEKNGRIQQGHQEVNENSALTHSEEKVDDEQGIDGNEGAESDRAEQISEVNTGPERIDDKKNEDSIVISAVYMPFVSFSTHSQMINFDKTISDPTSTQQAPEQNNKAWGKHQELMKAYADSVIHRSSTLDESYYHFSKDQGSQRDRQNRNQHQVVAKLKNTNAGQSEVSKAELWPVVRVNQLWVWTIGNKWIISATSTPVDDVEQEWVEGFREHLNKQVEARGAQSRPDSTDEMMKLLVDYCIGSYERRRTYGPQKDGKWNSGLSIRQSFSDYLNWIGRHETELFENYRSEAQQQSGSTSHDSESISATSRAELLFAEVKDIRDELNILKSVATYQSNVQNKLFGKDPTGSGLTANFVVSDIKEMDFLASRIQSAVKATLSLQQSKIANRQTEEAAKQGRTLMVFTVTTILFLPMSFLSSLFALDVASFKQTPGWAFGVLFGTSFLLFIPFASYAAWSENFIGVFKKGRSKVEKGHNKRGLPTDSDKHKQPQPDHPESATGVDVNLDVERGDDGEGALPKKGGLPSWFQEMLEARRGKTKKRVRGNSTLDGN